MLKLTLFAFLVTLSLAQSAQKADNIEYLSMGYNVFFGNPLASSIDPGFCFSPIFNLTYLQNQTSADGKFLEPDMITVVSENSCVLNSAATAITSTQSYLNSLDVFASVDAGCPFGGFSASTNYKTITENTNQESNFYTLSTGQCSVYVADITLMNLPQLSDMFIQDAITYLEGSDSDLHYDFLGGYGTHYVTSITMGSRLSVMNQISESAWQSLDSEGVSVTAAAQASFMGFYAGFSTSVSTNNTQTQEYESASTNFQMTTIGSLPSGNANAITWAQQAITNPMPIQYNLAPLSDLFTSLSVVTAIESATLTQIQANLNAALNGGYCNYLLSQGSVATCSAPASAGSIVSDGDADTNVDVVDGSGATTGSGVPVVVGSCVLCASGCGGIYSESQGIFDVTQEQPTWFMDYSPECGNTNYLGEYTYDHGVDMCCMPEVNGQVQGSCRMCSSCGGQFTYQTGSILDGHPNINGWQQAYDSDCDGNLQGNSDSGAGYDLCCDQPDVCAFCATCGGQYAYETGVIGNTDTVQNAFGFFGESCSGSVGWEEIAGASGMKLCCAHLQ